MCICCCVREDVYGEVLPGIVLMRATVDYFDTMKTGQWGLVISNDPFAIFDRIVDDPGDEADDEAFEDYIKGLNNFREGMTHMSALDGYTLVKAALKRGYRMNVRMAFDTWLYEYLGRYIKTATVHHAWEAGTPDTNE